MANTIDDLKSGEYVEFFRVFLLTVRKKIYLRIDLTKDEGYILLKNKSYSSRTYPDNL